MSDNHTIDELISAMESEQQMKVAARRQRDRVTHKLFAAEEELKALAGQRDELMQARNGLIENNDALHIQLAELRAQRDEGLAREAEMERENRLLRHDCASFLETMAKTCDLMGIDPESAQNAQRKPSDVLYEHAKDLQQRLAEAEKLLRDSRSILNQPGYRLNGTSAMLHGIDTFLAIPGCADGEKSEQPAPEKYAEVLAPFLSLMTRELHANAAKGDRPAWLQMTPEQGLLEIYYHVSKLQKAVRDNDPVRVAENTADVANMAMMMADIFGLLESKK